MDIYNMSHCKDMTAAIAVSRADGKPCAVRQRHEAWCGLTYKIGEVAILKCINDTVMVWRRNGQDRYITREHGKGCESSYCAEITTCASVTG